MLPPNPTRITRRPYLPLAAALTFSILLLLGFNRVLVQAAAAANPLVPAPAAQAPIPSAPQLAGDQPWIDYAPGVALVKVKRGVVLAAGPVNAAGGSAGAESLQGLLQALNTTTIAPVFAAGGNIAAANAATYDPAGLNRIYRVQWSADVPVEQAVAVLAGDPNVEYAEPDYLARPARTPNDPEYGSQWALPQIGAPAAWDITTGSPGVVLAIVDSGVDTAHPEFTGRLWVNGGEVPANGVDDDLNGKIDDVNGWSVVKNNGDLADPNGHGTQVGGVAGAAADNGVGIAGMCWQCRLMFVNAMQAGNVANYSDIAAAIQYASSNNAQVINLSLGGYADSSVLHDAIKEAATRAVIVAGAGNDDSSAPFYPAAYPEVLAVAATDSGDQKAIFSNYGAWVDVSAPGKDIRTTTLGGYATDSGTSLAAPFVSGLAGLIWSQHPTWTAAQVKWQILNTAANIDGPNPAHTGLLGKGRIAAGTALATDPQPAAAVEGYAVDGQAAARPAPGQALQLVVSLRNLWLPAQALQGMLSSSDPYVNIGDNAGTFGDIAPGQVGSNAGDPFGVTISGSTPYNRVLAFSLALSGAGGYNLVVPFSVQVRSAVETLGNTIYTQDTTWTSDKTYILNGTIIVNPGITLTIQPGTAVKGNLGKFIRIDGTLIARGTADQPILFTTNSITTATWSGLRFTENAVDASFDAAGTYVGGSIVQYATISYADIGMDLATRAPYIADSSFNSNGVSVQIGSNNNGGAPTIERSTFTAGRAITLNGGQPLIRQNRFVGVGSTVSGSGAPRILQNIIRDNGTAALSVNGSPAILGNVIQNNQGDAIQMQCCGSNTPVIHDNVIVGNGGGINASGLQLVDIEHNLVAGNGGSNTCLMPPCSGSTAAVSLEVQLSGSDQGRPVLVYNADRDEYLAVWFEYAAPASILYQRLGAEGQPLGSVQRLSGFTVPFQAQAVYQPTKQRYLIVWAGMMRLNGLFVPADGDAAGSSNVIFGANSLGSAEAVRVVHQPSDDTFLVVYRLANGNGSIVAQRLTTDGALLGNPITVGDMTLGRLTLGALAADSNTGKSLITFYSEYYSSRVWGGWVEPATLAISPTVLYEDAQWRRVAAPAAAFGAGASRYAVVWEQVLDFSVNFPQGLMVQPVDADGVLSLGPTRIVSDTGQPLSPRLAYGGADQFLVVWPYQYSTPGWPTYITQISGQRIDAGGAAVGAPILISAAVTATNGMGTGKSDVAIAYNSRRGEYLVAWTDSRTGAGAIWAQRLDSAGRLLDNAWTATDETNPANNFRIGTGRGIRYNTIINNAGYGLQLGGAGTGSVPINHNNLFGNSGYELYLAGGNAGSQNFTVDAANNFWNVDASQIPGYIRDCTFDGNGCGYPSSTLGRVAYDPPLLTPDQTAPAFVRSASLAPNPVGIQRGTVTIDFSAPMSTAAPLAASFHDARRGTIQNFPFTTGPMDNDLQGRVWFGGSLTATLGISPVLRMYNGQQWITYTYPSGVNVGQITALHAADNGDIWVAHGCCTDTVLSRLRGTSWTTYSSQLNGNIGLNMVTAIGEDAIGNIWVGDAGGAVRFNGITWRRDTTNGLVDNQVYKIARDGLGRLWFAAGYGVNRKLHVFDGSTWRTYSYADGLPQEVDLGSMFADTSGRIWATFYDPYLTAKSVGMFDGSGWHFFGSAETGGKLSGRATSFAENGTGAVWIKTDVGMAMYQDGTWSSGPNVVNSFQLMLFDRRDNLWFGGSTSLAVRWGSSDRLFTDGKWLSPTRFEAGYDFTAEVPPGQYTVQADEAVDAGGMTAYPGSSDRFTVDFGVGIALDPPLPPAVTAQTDGSLNKISASWRNSSPYIDQYRYAIGTTPNARNVVGWTYLAATSFTRNDLPLAGGQQYYVTVQARNTSGLWSANGTSAAVRAGTSSYTIYMPHIRR